MKISKELLKGSTAIMILEIISEADSYGYEIIQKIMQRSKGALALQAGTLYPILHSMLKEKLIAEYEKESPMKRPRKYYRITVAGRLRLAAMIEEWKVFTEIVGSVLKGENA